MNDARGNDPSIMQDAVRVGFFSKGIDEMLTWPTMQTA